MAEPLATQAARRETLELVARVQDGDMTAAPELLRRMSARVWGMVLFRMSPRLHRIVDPEEMVQEVWSEAFRTIRSFDPRSGGSFGSWLGAIAERIVGRLEEKGAPRRNPAESTISGLFPRHDMLGISSDAPLQADARQTRIQDFVQAIRELPEDQREVMAAWCFEECDAAEIATRLRKSKEEVYALLRRGSSAVQQSVGGTDSGEFPAP